jgi:hemoglobin
MIEVGLSEAQIALLVDRFYERVREDDMLGPVFDQAISDWPHHLGKMVDFWSSVMLTTGRYKGNPMMMHLKHKARIAPAMFGRWLELWGETAHEILDEHGSAAVADKAERIAESLQLGLFFKLEPRAAAAA